MVVDRLYTVQELYKIFVARMGKESRLEARPKGPIGQK